MLIVLAEVIKLLSRHIFSRPIKLNENPVTKASKINFRCCSKTDFRLTKMSTHTKEIKVEESEEKINDKLPLEDSEAAEEANEKTVETNSPLENKESNEPTSKWTAVWDDNAQAYYWWNTETDETTWINPESNGDEYNAQALVAESSNPLDFLLDRIDAVAKKKLDNGEEVQDVPDRTRYESYESYKQYYEQPEVNYASTAHFNARTGRFTTQEDVNRLNPENLTIESRAKRQMQVYFDVDSYTEERNNEKLLAQEGRIEKKKPLSRKEVEYFKKMKKEKKSKKAREWLMQ